MGERGLCSLKGEADLHNQDGSFFCTAQPNRTRLPPVLLYPALGQHLGLQG